ncbi:BON domain-containing protein [Ottowia sp.]|uniref:BON domain-containing protein n=1 Tax=Ottowia sp. TaxID=1898956 RepID=UPI0039E536B9
MQRRTSRLAALAALAAATALAAGLAACNKADQDTAKTEMDNAVARTEQAAREARARAAEAASEVRQAATEMGRDARQSAGAAAADAKVAARNAAADIKEGASDLKAEAGAALSRAGGAVGDVAISASVSAGLAKDPDLSALRITVDTQDGVVSLNGPAPSAAAKARAETIARNVKGVKSVQNHLAVGG